MNSKNTELKVVAVVQFNNDEALVLNRPVKFIFEENGNDYIGRDGPFIRPLIYGKSSSYSRAFAGSVLTLNMVDGSQRKIKNDWWAGHVKDTQSVVVGDIESLKNCYVYSSASITPEDYQALRDAYTGCVYPYWDYEKIIKYDDVMMSLYNSQTRKDKELAYEKRKTTHLIAAVKEKHNLLMVKP